ncbi:MAG: ATPase, T2SS/T4P/T4SS family, partial [Burkholderiales bacterium]
MNDPALNPAPLLPLTQLIPYHFAKSKGVVVAYSEGGQLEIWLRGEQVSASTLAEIRRILGVPVNPVIVNPEVFEQKLARTYSHGDNAAERLISDMGQDLDLQQLAQELPEITDLLEAEDDAPIIRLINALFSQALRENASDIHIEAFETRSVVRFRVDGTLRPVIEPQRALHAAIVSRIKVMA